MSQAGIISTSGGPVPPVVPTSFTTQNGIAVPAANILIVNGFDSTENNDNGIITKGGVVGTGTANEVDVVITNRFQGSGSTVGAVTTDLVTFSASATPGAYAITSTTAGYTTTGPAATSYFNSGIVRSTGVATAIVGVTDETVIEDASLITTDFDIVASGNNIILRVTGVAGLTINWNVVGYYVFVS